MSEETIIEEEINDDSKSVEEAKIDEEKEETEEIELKPGKTQRSDKTKFERAKDAKQRAIDNFKRGIPDPEFKVVKMANGKYRTYKRKEPLAPDPIKFNQVPENKRSSEIVAENINVEAPVKPKAKQHDPLSDIVWYNMSNQISEQLNKRLDAVNLELERLRHKNSKLKGKYKQLKQAIYITEEEEAHEAETKAVDEDIHEEQQKQEPQPSQQYINVESPIIRPIRRTNAINFNRFFN